jgi:hypothetical protein
MKYSLTLLTVGIIIIGVVSANTFDNSNDPLFSKNVYGHTFTPSESASFLSFTEQLQIELELVETNLANNNISLAEEHAEKAAMLLTPNITREIAEENKRIADELTIAVSSIQNISAIQKPLVSQFIGNIDVILGEAITTRLDQEQRENSTIQALALANLVDSILRNYGSAYAVGFDMTNISKTEGMMGKTGSNTSDMGLTNMSPSSLMMRNEINRNYSLVNAADYQSAQALIIRAQEKFESERALAPSNVTGSISQLEDNLMRLSEAIRSRTSPMNVMMIVHTQIHPNLLKAFT